MSDEGRLDFKLPGDKKINMALFWATNFFGGKDALNLTNSGAMLAEHGIGLNCWPSNKVKTSDHTFDFGSDPIPESKYTAVYRKLSEAAANAGKRDYLLVLFCQFQYAGYGITISKGDDLCFRRPMVFVSGSDLTDGATLVHEAGHAAGLPHDKTSTGKTGRNFMNEAETRSTMMKWQIEKMGKAYYLS
jgi:hypothetical protein